MRFQEITIQLSQIEAERFSDALLEQGALSVSIEDAQSNTSEEQALFGEPGLEPVHFAWQRSIIKALISENENAEELIQTCANLMGLQELPIYHITYIKDQNWVQLTQSQFEPIQIGQHIWVIPSWHTPAIEDQNAIVIQLDPGLAFGTGSHPTTHLCMQWLESHLRAEYRVLDYGCGSGILAILAKKCGAHAVSGTDIDPQAILSAKENSLRNEVDIDYFLPTESSNQQYDVVVANILANPLKLMAPMLSAKVKNKGFLVLSGILERQAQELIDIYTPWIKLSIWQTMDGWVCLAGQKNHAT